MTYTVLMGTLNTILTYSLTHRLTGMRVNHACGTNNSRLIRSRNVSTTPH